ncbi:hypothetical protein [Ralstonia sp. UBA689]|uniref:hypothetical protein n=1 Tax=Ralstonia sp. UBA689 TaxID=1947373 RepID=UPI0025D2C823|nr:hypothetical protein [Ralstonia sp. UBA689]
MTEGLGGFRIYDVSAWPIVMLRSGAQAPGYAAQWVREMNALLARNEPFVMLHGVQGEDEAHEDRRVRAVWLRENKSALAAQCRVLVHVEPDPERRRAVRAQAAIAVQAFKVPMEVVASFEEALAAAQRALAGRADQPWQLAEPTHA